MIIVFMFVHVVLQYGFLIEMHGTFDYLNCVLLLTPYLCSNETTQQGCSQETNAIFPSGSSSDGRAEIYRKG